MQQAARSSHLAVTVLVYMVLVRTISNSDRRFDDETCVTDASVALQDLISTP